MLRQRRIAAGVPVALALVTLVVGLLLPPLYKGTTTFVPETRSQTRLPQGLAGLAGQFGITLPQEARESPQFYAQVVRSRQLMERVLLDRYLAPRPTRNDTDSVTLLAVLNVRGRSYADRLEKGYRKLDSRVTVSVDNQSNIISLSVDASDPGLAAAVANRFVTYLNEFNTSYRESRAGARRKFVERRVADADTALRRAEEAVKTFYERNRGWQESPSLVLAEGELRRQVTISQEVYVMLRREYETARIEEVNDTPVITVIDAAAPPQRRSWPKVELLTLLALVVGTMVGGVWAYAADYVDRVRRQEDAGYREFSALLRQARSDLVRRLRQPFRRRRP
ncbi:MAG: GNVR domain-containing protein [Gemmatimonadales bacterium]